MNVTWEEGFSISARVENGTVVVTANAAGLRSLANICLALADQPRGAHIHLDEFNALEDGSAELIIERVPEAGNEVSR
ncbi:MAG: hypothetical protein IJG53_06060 [Eggerthellaceae bacterium]|nr:hypothetical protein [Eggerthellaceae bacterium]